MFAGIDIASERHVLARLDAHGVPIGGPMPISEDRTGYDTLLKALGPPPVLIAMEATGHHWKNLFAVLAAAGHEVALLNPFLARRFQDASLERTKTDVIDAAGLARLAFEKRPAPTRLHDEAAEGLRELVRHRDRLRQDFDDRVRQRHRLVDLGFPERKSPCDFAEFTRYVRNLDSMLAACLPAEYPTAHAFARATPRRLAKLRYDGRHFVGPDLAEQLVEAAKRTVGQHHGPAYKLQARHICQDTDLWRRRLAEIEHDIEDPAANALRFGELDTHEVGKLLTTIKGIGPQSAARIVEPRGSPDIDAVGDPARFKSAAAFAAYVGVVPGLKQSGKQADARAPITPLGNARLRMTLWMPVLGAVRRNPRLRAFHQRLRAAGKPPKLAIVAAMRKLLHAVHSVAKNRKPFKACVAAA